VKSSAAELQPTPVAVSRWWPLLDRTSSFIPCQNTESFVLLVAPCRATPVTQPSLRTIFISLSLAAHTDWLLKLTDKKWFSQRCRCQGQLTLTKKTRPSQRHVQNLIILLLLSQFSSLLSLSLFSRTH
jgi:hypothetical protein